MGSLSFGHWVIVLIVAVLLFGRGRISETMEDFGKGIRNFRRGLMDDANDHGPTMTQETEPVRQCSPDNESNVKQPE